MGTACVDAIQHVRRMRGETESHLLCGSDGRFYVVKFRGNRQGTRTLANEWVASALARLIGLPVPTTAIVNVSSRLIETTPELQAQHPGLHFGSQHVETDGRDVWDYIPQTMLSRVINIEAFYGALAFDKWISNTDYRQAVFCPVSPKRFAATFIDHGLCFGGAAWTFTDAPLYGLCDPSWMYVGVTGWSSFDPWLSRIESMDENSAWQLFAETPSEWVDDRSRFETLVAIAMARRFRLRAILEQTRRALPSIFPNWPCISRLKAAPCTTIS